MQGMPAAAATAHGSMGLLQHVTVGTSLSRLLQLSLREAYGSLRMPANAFHTLCNYAAG